MRSSNRQKLPAYYFPLVSKNNRTWLRNLSFISVILQLSLCATPTSIFPATLQFFYFSLIHPWHNSTKCFFPSRNCPIGHSGSSGSSVSVTNSPNQISNSTMLDIPVNDFFSSVSHQNRYFFLFSRSQKSFWWESPKKKRVNFVPSLKNWNFLELKKKNS